MKKFKKKDRVIHVKDKDINFIEYLIKQGYTEVQEKKK